MTHSCSPDIPMYILLSVYQQSYVWFKMASLKLELPFHTSGAGI